MRSRWVPSFKSLALGLVLGSAVSLSAQVVTLITSGGTLPATCTTGNLFAKTGAGAGLYVCISAAWVGPLTTTGVGDVVGPASATDEAYARFDGATGKVIQNGVILESDTGQWTLPDDIRQTFNPGANAAGLNVGSIAGDPGTPTNGDLWYDATANELTARINGASVALGAGGSGITELTGDVTAGPGSGSQAATIPNGTVTYAKMQDVSAADRLLGRGNGGGAGDVQEITLGTNLSLSGTTLNAAGGSGGGADFTGAGHPQGVQTGDVGQTYRDTTNDKLYCKEAGSGNTGWYRCGFSSPYSPNAPRMLSAQSIFTNTISAMGLPLTGWGSVQNTYLAGEGHLWDRFTSTVAGNQAGMFSTNTTGDQFDWVTDFDLVLRAYYGRFTGIDDMRAWFGLSTANPVNTDDCAGDCAMFKYSSAVDGNIYGVTDNGTTQTVSASVGAQPDGSSGDAVTVLRLRRVSGVYYFSLNNGAEVSMSADLPDSGIPYLVLWVNPIAGGEIKHVEISRVQFMYGS